MPKGIGRRQRPSVVRLRKKRKERERQARSMLINQIYLLHASRGRIDRGGFYRHMEGFTLEQLRNGLDFMTDYVYILEREEGVEKPHNWRKEGF